MRLMKFLVLGAGLLSIAGGLLILGSLILPNYGLWISGGVEPVLRACGLSSSSILCILFLTQIIIGGLLLWLGLRKPVLPKRVLSIALLSAAALLYLSFSPFWPITTILLVASATLVFFYPLH